jgi:16S rRNA (uracil1498-N3)-methyltransferase
MAKPLRVCLLGLASGEQELSQEASNYVCRVHRLREGSPLLLFDPERCTEADAELLRGGKRALCRVDPIRPGPHPGFRGLCLYLGRPKAAALERVVRDAVAFGVGRLVLLDVEHSVPRDSGNPERWRDLVLDETRQCERSDLLAIDGPRRFEAALLAAAQAEQGLGRHIVLDPRGTQLSLRDALSELVPNLDRPHALSLWVGPEAGFSPRELTGLREAGARAALLGEFVLRVPTAVAAALAAVTVGFPRPATEQTAM